MTISIPALICLIAIFAIPLFGLGVGLDMSGCVQHSAKHPSLKED